MVNEEAFQTPPNPRSDAARRGWESRRQKEELIKQKRALAAHKAKQTREVNKMKKTIADGKHSANEVFNNLIGDRTQRSKNYLR